MNTSIHSPSAEQLAAWQDKAQRMAPFGAARQLLTSIEIEVWATNDKPLAPQIIEALQTYMDQSTQIDNRAEIHLKGGGVVRFEFVNRYYRSGRLEAIDPDPTQPPPAPPPLSDPRLDA